MTVKAEMNTVRNWPFIPFEISNPVYTETDTKTVLAPYLEEWAANARSMLRYMNDETEDTASALNDTAESNPRSENETDGGNEPASEENSESSQE